MNICIYEYPFYNINKILCVSVTAKGKIIFDLEANKVNIKISSE